MVMAIFDFVNLFVNERKRKAVYKGKLTYSNFKADVFGNFLCWMIVYSLEKFKSYLKI